MNTIVIIYAVLIALTAGGLLVTTGGFTGVAEAALSSRSISDPDEIGDPHVIGDPDQRTYTR